MMSGWLVEHPEVRPHSWLTIAAPDIGHGLYYTPDASQALRFARKADAEQFIEFTQSQYNGFITRGIATEHMWYVAQDEGHE